MQCYMQEQKGENKNKNKNKDKNKNKNKNKNMSIGSSSLLGNKVNTSFPRQTFIPVEAVHATLRFSAFNTVDCLLIIAQEK